MRSDTFRHRSTSFVPKCQLLASYLKFFPQVPAGCLKMKFHVCIFIYHLCCFRLLLKSNKYKFLMTRKVWTRRTPPMKRNEARNVPFLLLHRYRIILFALMYCIIYRIVILVIIINAIITIIDSGVIF